MIERSDRAAHATAGALVVAVLLAARSAHGAPVDHATADREFQLAHRRFKEGDYEAALRHYQAAYDHAPHPNILYNLALTHERLLDYEAAIQMFKRYLEQPAAADAEQRRIQRSLAILAERSLKRLDALPARISVSSIPEVVTVTAHPILEGDVPGKSVWQGRTPAVFTVPAGRYLLRYREPGYFDEEVRIHAHVGQALLVQRHLRNRPRQVVVESVPRARLFLDDRPLGQTPYRGQIEVGAHRIRLERRFYLTHAAQIQVTPSQAPLTYRRALTPSGLYEMMLGAMFAGAGLGLVALRVTSQTEVENTPPNEIYKPLFAAVLPAAMGAGLVILAGGSNMPVSQAQLIIGNTAWGTLMGFGLGLGIAPTELVPHTLAAAGGLLGGMAGLGLYRLTQPGSGPVALFNSGALWGSTCGALVWALLVAKNPETAFIGRLARIRTGEGGWAMLGGTAIGVGIGAVLANLRPLAVLTRQQVALVDLFGLAGGVAVGLIGLGMSYGLTRDWQQAGAIAAPSAIGGIGVGLLTGALVLRHLRASGRKGEAPPRPRALRLDVPSLAIGASDHLRAELTFLRGVW